MKIQLFEIQNQSSGTVFVPTLENAAELLNIDVSVIKRNLARNSGAMSLRFHDGKEIFICEVELSGIHIDDNAISYKKFEHVKSLARQRAAIERHKREKYGWAKKERVK